MAAPRPLLDRLLVSVAPGVVEGHRPPPVRVADGVWSMERHLRMTGGAVLPTRTTIVRIGSGGLVVISPPPAHEDTFAAIDALGEVEALVAPNSFHYLYLADAARRYSGARVYLAPGLCDRVPSLPPGIDLDAQLPARELEGVTLGPTRGNSEVLLFHRPSRFLILSDVAFNMIHVEGLSARFFWRAFGVPAEFGTARTARLMLLNDRRAAGAALRRVLDWPFERILVAHGEIVQNEARARFERAFARYLE
jgi:hypothetical protein